MRVFVRTYVCVFVYEEGVLKEGVIIKLEFEYDPHGKGNLHYVS